MEHFPLSCSRALADVCLTEVLSSDTSAFTLPLVNSVDDKSPNSCSTSAYYPRDNVAEVVVMECCVWKLPETQRAAVLKINLMSHNDEQLPLLSRRLFPSLRGEPLDPEVL